MMKPSRSCPSKTSRHKQLEFQGQGFTKASDEFGGSLLKGHPKKARPLDSKLPVHLTLRARRSVLRLPKFFGKVQDVITEVSRKHGVKIYKQANVGNHLHLVLRIPQKKVWAGFIRELTGRIALVCREKASGQGKRARSRVLEASANRSVKGSDLHEDHARASQSHARLNGKDSHARWDGQDTMQGGMVRTPCKVGWSGHHARWDGQCTESRARPPRNIRRSKGIRRSENIMHPEGIRSPEGIRPPEGRFWMVRPHTRLVRGWKKAFKAVLDYIHLNQLEAEGRMVRKDSKTLKEYRQIFAQGFVLRPVSSG